MEDFIAASISQYFQLSIPEKLLAEEMRAAGGVYLDNYSVAGCYVSLPNCKTLEMGDSGKRILSGLWAKVNNFHIINVLLYVEDGRLSMLELAAPADDMPEVIHAFHFEVVPSEKIKPGN